MELTYPINLVGANDGAAQGDVLTRYGEFLGVWLFERNDEQETGSFRFIPDGENRPLFTEHVPFLSSGMLIGRAISLLCSSIREWHEQRS